MLTVSTATLRSSSSISFANRNFYSRPNCLLNLLATLPVSSVIFPPFPGLLCCRYVHLGNENGAGLYVCASLGFVYMS